jgi:hypothetical protein
MATKSVERLANNGEEVRDVNFSLRVYVEGYKKERFALLTAPGLHYQSHACFSQSRENPHPAMFG